MKRAFTLIELLVVIAIVCILLSAVIPMVRRASRGGSLVEPVLNSPTERYNRPWTKQGGPTLVFKSLVEAERAISILGSNGFESINTGNSAWAVTSR